MAIFGFRTGFVIGAGVGYVLGTRAGRERYEQIMAMWDRIRGDDRVGAVIEKAVILTEVPLEKAREVLGNGLRTASDVIEERTAPE